MNINLSSKDDVLNYFRFTHGPMPMGSSKFLEVVSTNVKPYKINLNFNTPRRLRKESMVRLEQASTPPLKAATTLLTVRSLVETDSF